MPSPGVANTNINTNTNREHIQLLIPVKGKDNWYHARLFVNLQNLPSLGPSNKLVIGVKSQMDAFLQLNLGSFMVVDLFASRLKYFTSLEEITISVHMTDIVDRIPVKFFHFTE